ncbi:MAG: hypothetical protein IKJ35_00160 [Clostridia bacterium]|nr:hypothetical protein [Clostridia bacterium]
MEKAIWNGKLYTATEIAKSSELEKSIRIASAQTELLCPDDECPSPILRYCHGEKKGAYFAHRNNCACDYDRYDKEIRPVIRKVKNMLYESFKARGFDVQPEVKCIPHHYTHLLLTLSNEKKVAIELGTHSTDACKLEHLSKRYAEAGIDVRWIVVSNSHSAIKEEHTYHIKRRSLNETKHRDVLIIDEAGTKIMQYTIDPNQYEFRNELHSSPNYPEIYSENGSLSELTFEEDELTLDGFYKRYREWLVKKRKAFDKKCEKLKEEERGAQTFQTHFIYSCPIWPQVGMKILHTQYGESVITKLEYRSNRTIITLVTSNGDVVFRVWETMLERNEIKDILKK